LAAIFQKFSSLVIPHCCVIFFSSFKRVPLGAKSSDVFGHRGWHRLRLLG
jgi:hypothetical protein